MNEFANVKSYFASRYIHASDDWIKSCIIWYKENYNTDTLTNNNDFIQTIYEQWLVADLRDIEVGCLPENLKSYKKLTLSRKYAVQMHYIIDSSKPAYSQLQAIRNINTTNELVTAETQNTFVSIPKPNRVLNMQLCDGIQEVKGMEYRPITKIHTNLAPGIKLLIIGPVDCRNGVLFLKENNIEILGGEIEDILMKNAYENILCRMIGLPENPNPNIKQHDYNSTNNSSINSNIKQSNNSSSNSSKYSSTIKQSDNSENILIGNINDFDDELMADTVSFEQKNIVIENKPITIDEIDTKINEEFENIDFDFDTHPDDDLITTNQIKSSIESDKLIVRNSCKEIIPKVVPSQPFVYIKQLVCNRQNLPKNKYTVKARIKTLVDKLKFVNNQWVLKCEIVDATSSIIVDFSNRVIEELVGYTADQMQNIRREIATSNFHKDQVVQALENAKVKLLSTDCLMDVEFSESRSIPIVIKFKEFYYSDLSYLEKRISLVTS